MTVTCALCENEVKTGDRREIRDGETIHTWCGTLEDARASYRFFIQNPDHDERWGMGFWYIADEHREYPMLENTGGLTVHVSAETSHGEGIPVKREFIEAFGFGWHWLMCYQPTPDRLADTIEDILERDYDGVPGIHERWALANLLSHALLSDSPLPHEWRPLIDFADACTAFGVPEVEANDD